jgi:hypothetical protein
MRTLDLGDMRGSQAGARTPDGDAHGLEAANPQLGAFARWRLLATASLRT